MKKVTMTISVDWENNGEKFWESFRESLTMPEEIRDHSNADFEFEVLRFKTTPERAQEIVAFLESLDGWNDGPSHAPHPLIISID